MITTLYPLSILSFCYSLATNSLAYLRVSTWNCSLEVSHFFRRSVLRRVIKCSFCRLVPLIACLAPINSRILIVEFAEVRAPSIALNFEELQFFPIGKNANWGTKREFSKFIIREEFSRRIWWLISGTMRGLCSKVFSKSELWKIHAMDSTLKPMT